jgi:hypothetical protein
MATTSNSYTGNGSTVLFSFTFPYLETTDIKVSLNGVDTTAYTLDNATTIRLNTAPASGVAIKIYRVTASNSTQAEFYPGSAIRATDLNRNFLQTLYVTQETQEFVAGSTSAGLQVQITAATNTANNAAISAAASASSAATSASVASSVVSTSLQKAGDVITGNIDNTATGYFDLPVGSTAQRPGTPNLGMIRFNSDLSAYEGYNSAGWLPIGGGAKGGGTDDVFYENSQTITTNYTLTVGKNAMSAGPVTVQTGATVVVPSGSSWTVV